MQQNRCWLGLRPRPTERAGSASQNALAVFKGPSNGSGREGREREIEGRQNDLCPRAPETLALPLLVLGRAGGPRTLVCGGHNLKLRHCDLLLYQQNDVILKLYQPMCV